MAKVFISAGHGGSDPGAIGNGLKEKDINLWVASACGAYLKEAGVDVRLSRTRDENDPVGEEVAEANAFGADIAVSFHNNAGGGDGSETWYYTGSKEGKCLATLMEEASKQLGQNSRGVKATKDLYFLRKTAMIAVLVETAFIDTSDINIINTEEKAKSFGIAYGVAICQYLNISLPSHAVVGMNLTIQAKCDLNIRKGPGIEYEKTGQLDTRYKYTIVAQDKARDGGTWGKLKSGIGWVNISDAYVIKYNS